MLRATCGNRVLAGILLVVVASGVCWAETVNINPHKIVLNAQGAADDVQANVHIILPGSWVVDIDVTLSFDGIVVAQAESAFYCVLDDILIVGFDRTDLQKNPDVQAMANSTVIATVTGSVTVEDVEGDETTTSFSGSDTVEIVAPGNKER
jgi:hypothetical protein